MHPGYGCMSCPRADAPESEVELPVSNASSSDLPDNEAEELKEVCLSALQNIGGRSVFAKVDNTTGLPNPGLQIVESAHRSSTLRARCESYHLLGLRESVR